MSNKICIREQHPYSIDFIKQKFSDYELDKLLINGVCQNFDENHIKFNFVGVISFENIIIAVLPKIYATLDEKWLLRKVPLTIKVLEKYSGNNFDKYEDADYFSSDPDNNHCSELAIAKFLIEDYHLHGLFHTERINKTENGIGDINWSSTIETLDPIFSNNQPIYTETINEYSAADQNNVIVKIHKWALSYIYKNFRIFLGLELPKNLSRSESLMHIGETTFLVYQLRKFLNHSYKDRDIRLLKALLFLLIRKSNPVDNKLNLYGTKKFENIWEQICCNNYQDHTEIKGIFPEPKWNILGRTFTSKSKLIPDLVIKDPVSSKVYLFDAKYYKIKFLNQLSGEPSYKDILKQFLYQSHLEKHFDSEVFNAFLFPVNDAVFRDLRSNDKTIEFYEEMAIVGSITYPLFGLKEIRIILCPFEKYLKDFVDNKVYKLKITI